TGRPATGRRECPSPADPARRRRAAPGVPRPALARLDLLPLLLAVAGPDRRAGGVLHDAGLRPTAGDRRDRATRPGSPGGWGGGRWSAGWRGADHRGDPLRPRR